MRIQKTVSYGWEEMFKMLMLSEMEVDIAKRTEARGNAFPNLHSSDPQERCDAQWLWDMQYGREWARRMDDRTEEFLRQGMIAKMTDEVFDGVPVLFPREVRQCLKDASLELSAAQVEQELSQQIEREFYALIDRIDELGGAPNPASDDKQEREDALLMADVSVARLKRERDICAQIKQEADFASQSQT